MKPGIYHVVLLDRAYQMFHANPRVWALARRIALRCWPGTGFWVVAK